MGRLSMHDFGAVSYDDIVRANAIAVRDYVQEVNARGRPSIMGIEVPPTDAAGMMADGITQFFGNVATVHDRQASGLSRLWAGVQVVLTAWSGVAALRSMSTTPNARAAIETLCFAAGTKVHVEDGLKSIEDVEVGDLVWAKDESSGEIALRRVARTFTTPDQQVLEVVLEGPDGLTETIRATGEHPFWTKDRGWVSADELGSDDEILSRDGDWLNVTRTDSLPLRETVYNFEVEDFHTYFVGEQGAWVHNTCVDKARDLASRLPSELRCWGQCKQFASALQEGLQQLGVKGTRIEIQVGKGITPVSDTVGVLAERGVGHAAVRVGDTVFDNLRPGGIPYQEFIDDLGGSSFFGTPFVRLIETIF